MLRMSVREWPFQHVVLGTLNTVTGTTFSWVRTTPAGIVTSLPTSVTSAPGGIISGIFSNTTDDTNNGHFYDYSKRATDNLLHWK